MRFIVFAFGLFSCHIIFAQLYKVGSIDIYGNRKTSSDVIYTSLELKEGDSISPGNFKTGEMAAKLRQIPGVKYATINPVCCDKDGNVMLYIGIGETDSVILKHRNSPSQNLKLPAEMINAYRTLGSELEPAIKKGEDAEDDSHGYALVRYSLQERNKIN